MIRPPDRTIPSEQQRLIVRLFRMGFNPTQISRKTQVSRPTVYKYVKQGESERGNHLQRSG